MTMMTISRKINILFLLILAVFPRVLKAQNPDVRLRLSTKIEKDFFENFNSSLEYEHRFDQNLSSFDKAFIEPAVSYDFLKHYRIGLSYRFIYDQNKLREQGFEQRIASYLRSSFDIEDFEIKCKVALQYGFDDVTTPSFSYDQKLINRNSIELEYNWFGSKFTPFTEYELFYHINHPNGGILNQWRWKLGSSYELSKKSKIQFYYLFEKEFNVAFPVNAHILGFGYSYKL